MGGRRGRKGSVRVKGEVVEEDMGKEEWGRVMR